MHVSIKKAFVSNVVLKGTSLILGYMLWSIIGETFPTNYWFKVPLCFYNVTTQQQPEGPEYVWVHLKGRRSLLSHIDTKSLAIHINAQELKSGPNSITLSHEHLFVSPALALNDYIPHNIVVTIHETLA